MRFDELIAKEPDQLTDLEQVGLRIRYIRALRGMSVQNLADNLYVSPATISWWERGARSQRTDWLAKAMGVAEHLFYTGDADVRMLRAMQMLNPPLGWRDRGRAAQHLRIAVRAARKQKGWSKAFVVRQIGVGRNAYYGFEAGYGKIRPEKLCYLMVFLELDILKVYADMEQAGYTCGPGGVQHLR
ncbi:MAG: helix-turn-helix transcriptional regulator [Eubacteriales bacterium]|nr:helix-turn-helix transcriptional regulator [Eubacteriales bacterium]